MSLLTILLIVIAVMVVVFSVVPLRRALISTPAMGLMKKALPAIGETEEIALRAGTTWWEKDLFSGSPQWQKLLDFKVPALSPQEQAFLDGPVNALCAMLDEDAIYQQRQLPEAVWEFLKTHKFLGMVIAEEYGGLGFSAAGHAAVITRIASVSIPVAITVMVPNSLGPGELLHLYGTDKQKQHYLPRLARGDEIPCFALTEPHAGSDAASGRSFGIVCRDLYEGQEVLGIRLSFNKRYITLAPVATVIGLAFKLQDPDHLLGEKEEMGITCALLPRDIAGLDVGRHHDPMGVPFDNGPVSGENVFIPLDFIIGGKDYAGQGWRMLMECLAIGRSISLPSLSVGGAQMTALAMSAYAAIRVQFGLPLQKFEGIREPLARIFAASYWMSATRDITCGAIDSGEKPSVVSAIVKHYLTEELRTVVNAGMDIQGGGAISRGDRNVLARIYVSIPIAITVEGANILTRSLIVFGQGAMRCHPYLLDELNALRDNDKAAFDKALSGHLGHVVKNTGRAFWHGLTAARFAAWPGTGEKLKTHYQRMSRLSAAFAFAADMGLLTLGGSLKRKEYLSGRYADALAWLYIASMTLKRFHDEGTDATRPLVNYILLQAEYNIQEALAGIIANFPSRLLALVMRLVIFPIGRRLQAPGDANKDAVVEAVLDGRNGLRERLATDVYRRPAQQAGMGALEAAHQQSNAAAGVLEKLQRLRRDGKVEKDIPLAMARAALAKGLLTTEECQQLELAEIAMDKVIQVNVFEPDVYRQRK
jgi:acyl-CoA dehydrogenase